MKAVETKANTRPSGREGVPRARVWVTKGAQGWLVRCLSRKGSPMTISIHPSAADAEEKAEMWRDYI